MLCFLIFFRALRLKNSVNSVSSWTAWMISLSPWRCIHTLSRRSLKVRSVREPYTILQWAYCHVFTKQGQKYPGELMSALRSALASACDGWTKMFNLGQFFFTRGKRAFTSPMSIASDKTISLYSNFYAPAINGKGAFSVCFVRPSVILSFRPIKVCLLNSSYILAWIWMKLSRDVVPQV